MILRVHIDRVVLRGGAGLPDRAGLEEAIRGELAERIGTAGLPAGLRAGSARAEVVGRRDERPGTDAATARSGPGQGVGRALYGSLDR